MEKKKRIIQCDVCEAEKEYFENQSPYNGDFTQIYVDVKNGVSFTACIHVCSKCFPSRGGTIHEDKIGKVAGWIRSVIGN